MSSRFWTPCRAGPRHNPDGLSALVPPEGAGPFSFGLKPFLKGKAPRLRAAENERSVVQCHCVRCAHRGSPASSALVSATNENANYVRISRAAGSHR